MKKIIYIGYGYPSTVQEKLVMIKEIGFDGIFFFWDSRENDCLKHIKEIVDDGIYIETFHLPFDDCNSLWLEGDAGENYANLMIEGIIAASNSNVNTVIIHLSSGHTPPPFNAIGLNRVKRILEAAREYKVFTAFENLRHLEYLDYILENCQSDYLKFCFDSGHANAFTKNIDVFPFEKYTSYFQCVHFHDNLGDYDAHLIPLAGNIDWKSLMQRLSHLRVRFNFTAEAVTKKIEMDEKEYLKKIYESLMTIEKLYENS